jgi:prepilin-type processing-associated H-X9-DG protein
MKFPLLRVRPLPRPLAAGGFSLVEILVSLGIVTLLASLLLPAMKSARESSHTASCASNLSQIGKGLLAFAADNDGTLPPASDSTKNWPASTFMVQINPYLGNLPTSTFQQQLKACFDGVFRCRGKKDWSLAGPTDRQRTSYGMNTFDANAVPSVGKKLAAIEFPSKTLLVADVQMDGFWALRNAHYMYRDFQALRHQKRDNILFCDGHVEALPKDSFVYQGSNGLLLKE